MTKNLGMTRSRIDANLFTKMIGNELIMLLVYVDDLFILGPNDKSNETLRLLQEHFAMKQTGELTKGSEVQFLGRTIKRDLDSVSFSTSTNYVTALVDLLGITDNRETRITGSSSPFPKSDDTNSLNPANHSRYRRAVGMLQWIVPTRPDMAFATKERASALASPTNADMTALRHLVRYYRTTSDLELRIQPKTRTRVPEGEPELLSVEAYSDSDWAGCRDTRRSTSGGIIYFEGAVLAFWSRTQTTIALSICEAELYAINMATIEALNVKSTIEELIKNCKTNSTVYTDSSSAKSITSRRGVTRKTKHIELRQLFVQELVANGTLQVTKVGTLSNPADIFTKFVSSETIQRQLHAVGLRCTKLIHAIHAIRCVPSDFVEVSEKKGHETRAMAMLNFDVTKFLEAEQPKYDVKMFGDPYQVWYEDREKAITFCCITPGMTDYTTVFEIDEEVVTTAKIIAKCKMNTKLHWHVEHMRARCRCTRRRPDGAHGGVLNRHTGGFSACLSLSLSSLVSPLLSFVLSSLFSLFSFFFPLLFLLFLLLPSLHDNKHCIKELHCSFLFFLFLSFSSLLSSLFFLLFLLLFSLHVSPPNITQSTDHQT